MRLAGLVASLALALAAPAAAQDRPAIRVTLKPTGPTPDRLEVTSVISGLAAAADRPFLQVAAQIASIPGEPYAAGDIAAEDDLGPLPLTVTLGTNDGTGFGGQRLVTAARASKGDIRLRYTARIVQAMTPRPVGPSFDLRGLDGGFAGGGATFLLLPTDARTYRLEVRWDLPPGAIGVSNLGLGDVSTDGPVSRLVSAQFIAGNLGFYRADGAAPFAAFWVGRPNFDAPATMAWSARSYTGLKTFFGDTDARPYFIFGRPFPNARDAGVATDHAFVIEYGTAGRTEAAMRFMFTHEMFHHFVGSLQGPPGVSSWFGEGLAEIYKIRLPLRAGLVSPADYAEEVRTMTDAYYGNPRNRLPNAAIPAAYWRDSLVQLLPYNRGMIYFADLDAKVRAASGGRRSLDDLVLAMVRSRRDGLGYDEARWLELVRGELGEPGVADFQRMLAGDLIVPASDAFGPCLERRTLSRAQAGLGFADRSLILEPYTVMGLEPDSPAARAGLREGDRIRRWRGAERSNLHSTPSFVLAPTMTLEVDREGRTLPIRFATRSAPVAQYEWRLKPGAKACTIAASRQ